MERRKALSTNGPKDVAKKETVKTLPLFSPTVTQANQLIEASYRLTLEEKRLIIICISKTHRKKEIPEKLSVTAEEFASAFELNMKSAYKQLRDATDRLYERDIKFRTGNSSERMRWVYRVTYHEGQGMVSLKFSPDITPYIGHLQNQFTPYKLNHVKSLKSTYSIRLYELLSQYLQDGQRWITVDDLRAMFELEDKYSKYADLRKWVVEPSVDELNEKSNYDVTFKPEKDGRTVTKLWFFFKEKKQFAMDF